MNISLTKKAKMDFKNNYKYMVICDSMQKRDWIVQINESVNMGKSFHHSSIDSDKAQLLFACDTFRRKKHDVVLSIEPTVNKKSILHVVVHPFKCCGDFTVRREETTADIIEQVTDNMNKIRIRGCGTVINTVLGFTDIAVNSGWYIEKTMMNTLTQYDGSHKQKNTTLQIVLRRGSQPDTI